MPFHTSSLSYTFARSPPLTTAPLPAHPHHPTLAIPPSPPHPRHPTLTTPPSPPHPRHPSPTLTPPSSHLSGEAASGLQTQSSFRARLHPPRRCSAALPQVCSFLEHLYSSNDCVGGGTRPAIPNHSTCSTIITAAEGGGSLPSPLHRIGQWGGATFSFILMLSGFTTALRNSENALEREVPQSGRGST